MAVQSEINVYGLYVKPLLDRILAIILIVLLCPVIVVIWLLVLLKLGRPVLFSQKRPGIDEKLFNIYKFRTMTNCKDSRGMLLQDSERLTSFGLFLRKTSLDELPQLFNVLKGELSFIGPRPLLIEYLPLYNSEQKKRHIVKPGITGWAQVNGRNTISWSEKFKLDIWYVDHLSFSLDCKILLLTVVKVLKSSGISSANSSTMEKFTGN